MLCLLTYSGRQLQNAWSLQLVIEHGLHEVLARALAGVAHALV